MRIAMPHDDHFAFNMIRQFFSGNNILIVELPTPLPQANNICYLRKFQI